MAFHYLVNSYPSQVSAASFSSSTTASHHRRRGPRVSVTNQKHARSQRPSPRELMIEPVSIFEYRDHLEQWISFDLDDDIEFCPNLVSENDLVSFSSNSERSSLAGDSPNASPLQHPQTVLPNLSFSASSSSSSTPSISLPPSVSNLSMLPLYQPNPSRVRNAIPIINPATGLSTPSASPSHTSQSVARRW